MGHGTLNASQRKVLAKHVRGKIIHDLGAGDLDLSLELLKLGAAEVYAIDKLDKPKLSPWPQKLHYKRDYFHNIRSRMDTIFMSWPINHDSNLVQLLLPATKIIYLGKNTDGSMCGTPDLFRVMIRRELLEYEPDPKNCLIVVGNRLESAREPTGEEQAGLTCMVSYYSYTDSEHPGNSSLSRCRLGPVTELDSPSMPTHCPQCGAEYRHIRHPMKPAGVIMSSECDCVLETTVQQVGENSLVSVTTLVPPERPK